MDNIKYTLDGRKVSVIQELPNGYLVNSIYQEYEDGEEFEGNGAPYFIEKLYDSAPLEALDKKYLELSNKIAELQKQAYKIHTETLNLENEKNKKIALFKSFNDPAINLLENILNKTVTHFVFNDYGRVKIKTEKEIRDSDYSYKLQLDFELNNGTVKYNMYTRRDSYSSYPLFPCKSLDEAMQIATDLIKEGFKDEKLHWAAHYIDSAKKLGVEVPTEFEQKVKSMEISNAQTRINNKLKELEELTKALEALK